MIVLGIFIYFVFMLLGIYAIYMGSDQDKHPDYQE